MSTFINKPLIEPFNPNDKDIQCSKVKRPTDPFKKKTIMSQYSNLITLAIVILITFLTIHFYFLIKEKNTIESSTNDLLAKVSNHNETIYTISTELMHNKRIKNNLSNQMYQYKEQLERDQNLLTEEKAQLTKVVLETLDHSFLLKGLQKEQNDLKETLQHFSEAS